MIHRHVWSPGYFPTGFGQSWRIMRTILPIAAVAKAPSGHVLGLIEGPDGLSAVIDMVSGAVIATSLEEALKGTAELVQRAEAERNGTVSDVTPERFWTRYARYARRAEERRKAAQDEVFSEQVQD